VPDLAPEIRAYYERGDEADCLKGGFPSGPLEFARTKEIVLRFIGPAPLDVLDVGGAAGVHAAWLAQRGDRVQLVDPVPLHIEQAREAIPGVNAQLGDARRLEQANGSVDVVLLLGPLYHLVDRAERLLALSEARRVLRGGGVLFAAAISRFAALLDLLVRLDRLHEPEILAMVSACVETGVFSGTTGGLFTTAYFHRPRELQQELAEAGFDSPRIFNVEGPGFLVSDFPERWRDELRREAMLTAARLMEDDPEALGASSHLLAVASA
jgi:SAM-dependent methyltransferase